MPDKSMLPDYLRIYRTAPLPKMTPQRRKHSSINFMGTKFKVDSLDLVLTGELANKKPAAISDEEIVNRIFSDQALGFPITSALVQRLDRLGAFLGYDTEISQNSTRYDTTNTLFFPPSKRRRPGLEIQMAAYLNYVGKAIAEETGHTVRRKWAATSFNKPLPGSPHDCKPDIMLSPLDVDVHHWRQVDCVAETSVCVQANIKTKKTTVTKAFCMFTEQPTRRYIINIWMVGENFCVAYFDRSGQVTATYAYCKHHIFVRLIAGLMFGSDQLLGYDPTVLRQNGFITDVFVNGKQYQIMCALFTSQVLRGRGMVCWLATADGQQFVIKDTWADKDRQWEEAEFLQQCQKEGICGVPVICDREDVRVDGIPDSTRIRRDPQISVEDAENRVHCRLVMTLVCWPLDVFSCKSELIQAFIDIVEGIYLYSSAFMFLMSELISAHRCLVAVGILHRDLSLSNLALAPGPPSCSALASNAISANNSGQISASCTLSPTCAKSSQSRNRSGMILDFNYAIWLQLGEGKDKVRKPSDRDRTVSQLQTSRNST
jgi:hypothetical protein